jgi:hypothetical protein
MGITISFQSVIRALSKVSQMTESTPCPLVPMSHIRKLRQRYLDVEVGNATKQLDGEISYPIPHLIIFVLHGFESIKFELAH